MAREGSRGALKALKTQLGDVFGTILTEALTEAAAKEVSREVAMEVKPIVAPVRSFSMVGKGRLGGPSAFGKSKSAFGSKIGAPFSVFTTNGLSG
jgi:hypothetical protein